jgi:glycosyltransferase 2 family protein
VKLKKTSLLILKLVILGAILVWIARTFDRSQWESLVAQPKNWRWLGLSFLLVLGAHVLSFLRWFVFVEALGVPFTVVDAIRLGFLGNLFNFVSLGAVGGDVFKAIAAAVRAPGKRPEVIASVLVDRGLGLLGLIVIAALSLQFLGRELSPTLLWIRGIAWLMTMVGVGGLVAVVFVGRHLPIKRLNDIPWAGHTLRRMAMAGLLFEGRPWLANSLLLMSCLVHAFLTCGMYFISIGLYADAPSLEEHCLVVPPAFAVAAIPISPAGLGVQEMAVKQLFEELPGPPSAFSGLIVAVVFRIELIVIAALGGLYYIFGARDFKQAMQT